ncbi:MAG TPA: 3-hydroxyacyl-ACP dehydratase FabZ [Gemmatimonadaceae bacterium]|nr:3-hydroxyacyl-ACP dehydratase FabZ [Gemmatimonadaceae bacterium]
MTVTSLTPDGAPWQDAAAVLALLPHRYPFLLVDRLRVVVPGERAQGVKRVTGSEWFGAAGPAALAAMPGLLVVEALAQTSAAVLVELLDGATGAVGYFAAIERARFREPVRAGDTLQLEVTLRSYRRGIARLRGEATVEGRRVAVVEFTTVVRGRGA